MGREGFYFYQLKLSQVGLCSLGSSGTSGDVLVTSEFVELSAVEKGHVKSTEQGFPSPALSHLCARQCLAMFGTRLPVVWVGACCGKCMG